MKRASSKTTYKQGLGAFVSLISLFITIGVGIPGSAHADIVQALISLGKTPIALAQTASAFDASDTTSVDATDAVLVPAINTDPSPSTTPDQTVADGSLVPSANLDSTNGTPGNNSISIYTVRSGDTIASIAKLYDISPNTILWANNLPKGTSLKKGQILTILPISGIPYTTKKGDTLSAIAKRFGGDSADIAAFNGLDSDAIASGTSIIIPNGEAPSVPNVPVKSSTKNVIYTSRATHFGQYRIVRTGSEAAHDLGPVGTADQIAFYAAPLAHYTKTQDIHGYNAVDLAAPEGSPVMASAPGTVIVAKDGGYNGGYGSYIVIAHSNGSQTLYGHLSHVSVSRGDTVSRGDVIGAVGETGWSTGPHVHFEIRNGILNPF